MTEKQKYLLKLFREVDEICREHNLRYVLAGGSLIGALRHEGFVPWDDDVDLYMPRSDWEKFIEICKTELPPDREIQCKNVYDFSAAVLPDNLALMDGTGIGGCVARK